MDLNSSERLNGLTPISEYQHTMVWTGGSGSDSPSNWSSLLPTDVKQELSKESITVQAAYKYLSDKHVTLWQDWLISDPWRRLHAARWLAAQCQAVDAILRDGSFSGL
jgi:hypothetical protein